VTLAGRTALSVGALAPITLEELLETLDLQERFDVKYLVPNRDLDRLVGTLGDRMRVLEVAGRRGADLTSVYFDTADLASYRAHRQGRRRRFKIRTRHYGDPGVTVLEIKTKGQGERTAKYRRPHTASRPDALDADGLAFVARALETAYAMDVPDDLRPTVTTRFRRTTLADRETQERVTIDTALVAEVGCRALTFLDNHSIVECKATVRRGPSVRALTAMGLRPATVSKYCVSVAALRPDLARNPWIPILRKLQG
jgi:hypothetical protein